MEKKGEHPYLGIIINYDRDKKLDKFSLDTLKVQPSNSGSFLIKYSSETSVITSYS